MTDKNIFQELKAFLHEIFGGYGHCTWLTLKILLGVDAQNLPQAVAEIPWGHNMLLLEKVKDLHARFWYIPCTCSSIYRNL